MKISCSLYVEGCSDMLNLWPKTLNLWPKTIVQTSGSDTYWTREMINLWSVYCKKLSINLLLKELLIKIDSNKSDKKIINKQTKEPVYKLPITSHLKKIVVCRPSRQSSLLAGNLLGRFSSSIFLLNSLFLIPPLWKPAVE